MTGNSTWNNLKSGRTDPTVVNPDLKLLVLTGDWEEYSPGPMQANGEPAKESRTYDICAALRRYFAHFTCTREPGVGHYIFTHKDEFGNDIVLRELLRATQITREEMASFPARMPTELKRLKAEADARKIGEVDKLAQRYSREVLFRQWFDAQRGGIEELRRLIADQDQGTAQFYSKQFDAVLQQRDAQVRANITTLVEAGKLDAGTPDLLLAKYYDYLDSLNPIEREALFQASDQVYDLSPDLLATLKPKAPKEKAPEVAGALTLPLADGTSFTFDPAARPSEDQVPVAVNLVKTLRESKQFKEAQPIVDWIKKWVDAKYAKDRTLESWTYRL